MSHNRILLGLTLVSILTTSRAAIAQSDTTFKPSGTIVGQFFGDYEYKVHADQYKRGVGQYSGIAKDYSSFDIRRMYLGYNYTFSPSFMGEFLLASEGNLDGSGNRGIYVKLANLQWKNIFGNSDLVFGAQATPSFPLLTEGLWGYRSIERTPLDKYKLVGSNDLGIALRGAFDDKRSFGYDVMYGNGSGSTPENDRYKRVYADLWAKLFDKQLVLDLYGDFYRKKEIPAQDITTAKFFAAYQSPSITFGVEAFMQVQAKTVFDSNLVTGKHDTVSANPFGVSFFARGPIASEKLSFFARLDLFNPDANFESSGIAYPPSYNANSETFVTAGLDWMPIAGMHILPNIWYTSYSMKLSGSATDHRSDYDLVPRVTFYFKY